MHTGRKIYIDWLKKSKLRSIFSKNIKYRDLSLWWLTNLIDNDLITNSIFYKNLNNFLNRKEVIFKKNSFFFLTLRLIKRLVNTLLFNIFLKLFYKNKINKKNNYDNCFYSDIGNFTNFKNNYIDRQYGLATVKIKQSCYLILAFNNIFSFLNKKKNFKNIPLDFFLLNKYIKIYDIFFIYFKTFQMLFKLIFILRNKNYFIINNLDCSSIIKPFLLESFFGKMQEELINGIAIESFLKSIKIKNFLNYLEFYPSSRSIYYFIKSVKDLDIKIITINHTTYSDNLYLQIDKNYFSKKRDYLFYSPKPDFFLTQGLNFLNKLKKSFSKNYVCAIGNLKIELEDLSTIKEKIFFFKKSRKKILTIITSYNDNYDFIDILNKCDLRDYLVVVRNHPYLRNDIDDFERDFKHSFVTYDNFSTRGIMSASDLILTGDSSLAYDAIIRSKKVLRVVNYNKPILFVDSSIPTVDNHILMQKYLDKKISFKHISKNKIIRDFFYKYDQLAHKRLSNFLKKL